MRANEIINSINDGTFDAKLKSLYGTDAAVLTYQKQRYAKAVNEFTTLYGDKRDISVFSVGGRSEISGNHTDHNHGKVIAAAVDLDIIAVAALSDGTTIRVKSEGFDEDIVDISTYTAPDEDKYYSSASIIAGMARAFKDAGLTVCAFDAYTTSNVFKGSGLSSSAAFEDMIGNVFNHFANAGMADNVEIAKMAQFAENQFFGKPCGLMDQTACAVGGFVTIDFADPKSPVINKINYSLSGNGYALCIVNTGGNHADLNEDYASVPAEMKKVASYFGKSVLRDVDESDVIANIAKLREFAGDRAVLRALHFIEENKRVAMQAEALKNGDTDAFLAGVMASGNSSYKYLQNVFTVKNVAEQGISLALCLTESTLRGTKAAWRVHGGGFAGTIQAFVPLAKVDEYKAAMESAFGANSVFILNVRADGAVKVI
jgi:Galactokinase